MNFCDNIFVSSIDEITMDIGGVNTISVLRIINLKPLPKKLFSQGVSLIMFWEKNARSLKMELKLSIILHT